MKELRSDSPGSPGWAQARVPRPRYVSPSRVARYFFHECDRFLRYSSTPRADRAADGIPTTPFETRPVTRAILETGYAWEERLLADFVGNRASVAPGDGPVRERFWGADETAEMLASLEPGRYLYQPTLVTPDSFYRTYALDPAVVTFTDCRPDLIEIQETNDGRLLRVIDVKASPGVKLAHRIQATLYSLILEAFLDAGNVPAEVSNRPAIWLTGDATPTEFDIRAMRPPLEAFLQHRLQPILDQPADQAAWHVYYRCEWCEYFRHCQQEMRATDSVSRVPYLTAYAKEYLGSLDPPVKTVDEFGALLAEPNAPEILEQASSLAGQADRLLAQVDALRTGTAGIHGGASLAMPRAEHVRIVLTLQREPVSGQVYAYALYAQGLRDVLGDNPPTSTAVAVQSGEAELTRVERALVNDLYGLMAPLHEFNDRRSEDWAAQKTLQAFVFDSYERDLLTEVLVRRVADPVVAQRALQVFFYFQRPELLPAEDHPTDEVFFPVVVLTGVLRQLFALPLEVSFRFADVVTALQPSRGGFSYRDSEYWSFELSNQLRSDAIFAVWHRDKAEYVERIERELRARVWAANSVVNGMREALTPYGSLFAWPPRFRLPAGQGFGDPLLSRLAFLARYESVTSYLALREARMTALPERFRSGQTIQLRYLGHDRFVIAPGQRDLDIEAGNFANWLLAEDRVAGRRALLAYHDYQNRARPWIGRSAPLALAAISEVTGSASAPNRELHLRVTPSQAMPALVESRQYLLDRRYTDYLSHRVVAELAAIDADDSPRIPRLLDAPHAIGPLALPDTLTATARGLAERHGMTTSQLTAFNRLMEHPLQLIWGPPGTGKTHFLALAILCLAEAHRSSGLAFKVGVTAFTHAAIDNCLRKLAELDEATDVVDGGLPVAKLDGARLAGRDLAAVPAKKAGDWLAEREQSVVGGTVWAMQKGLDPEALDLLVIDEGSQLRVPESAIALRRLAAGGRLVIAGDDRQLPPIVQAYYPEPEPGDPILHRSVYECLAAAPGADEFRSVLLENFRMNETLCRYPREQIYVSGYASATQEIASRRLEMVGQSPDALADIITAPEYPLVVGVLDGIRATAENRVEADLVAAVALDLRERLVDRDGLLYADDHGFWRRGLFIVSPHHAQINAIQRALAARREWEARPFVDTVDTMQGQECDAVITSYGVSDVEYALREREFIYSLNRLNVAITRARAKSVVLLPRPLIEPPVPAYEDDRVAEGIAFMQGLVEFAEKNGSVTVVPLPEHGTLTLYRVPHLA